MKKLLTITAACAILAAPATAVQKCVALQSGVTTCDLIEPDDNTVDWVSECTTNDTFVPIKGIGVCAATVGSKSGDTTDTLNVDSDDVSDNKYCWCKMISPVVSTWVYVYSGFLSAISCARNCSWWCADAAQEYPAFRSALFSTMSD